MNLSHLFGENRLTFLTLAEQTAARLAARKSGTPLTVAAQPNVNAVQQQKSNEISSAAARNVGMPVTSGNVDLNSRSLINPSATTHLTGSTPLLTGDNSTPLRNPVTTSTNPQVQLGQPVVGTTNTGYTGGFADLKSAQDAQNSYYKLHGAGDPTIDAAIYNLQNPGAAKQSMDEMQGAIDRSTQQNAGATAPMYAGPSSSSGTDQYNGSPSGPTPPTAPVSTYTGGTGSVIQQKKTELASMGSGLTFTDSDAYLTTQQKNAKKDAYDSKKAALTAEINNLEFNQKKQQDKNQSTVYGNGMYTQPQSTNTDTSGGSSQTGDQSTTGPSMDNPFSSDPILSQTWSNLNSQLNSSDARTVLMATQRMKAIMDDGTVQKSADAATQVAKANNLADESLAGKVQQQAKDTANAAEDDALFALHQQEAIAALDMTKAENAQRQQNVQNELRARNVLSARGGGGTGGLDALQRSLQAGTDALTDILGRGAINSLSFAKQTTQIIRNHQMDMNQADIEYDSNIQKAHTAFSTAMANITQSVTLDTKDKRSAVDNLTEKMMTTLETSDMKRADTQISLNKQLYDHLDKIDDNKRNDANTAMSSLLTLRGQGVQNINGAMLKSIQDRLPGIDVNDILKDPTTASLTAAQKMMTDSSTSSASFKDPDQASIMDGANLAANGMSVAAGDVFRNEVARKLRAGDTKGAKSYMLTAIANDLKGPSLTEYNARADQDLRISSVLRAMDDNPNFDYSGYEYLKQKALASPWVPGDASAEYATLLAPIAQLSAEIVHGLSGAAVSPSEWSRLTTFLPQGGEGHDVLKAKLQNLQKYAGWLNEAHLARAANLPVPPDPSLSKSEQKAQQNAPKEDYTPSNESIHDTLAPAQGRPLSYISNFRVTQNYGSMWDAEHGLMAGAHNAIDLAPKVKGELTRVPALRGGKVIAVNSIKGLGNSVVVQDEDGNTYEYGHLASEDVKVGDSIENDQSLGIMGNTGSTDGGVHLHLGVKDKSGKYVDPRDYLS